MLSLCWAFRHSHFFTVTLLSFRDFVVNFRGKVVQGRSHNWAPRCFIDGSTRVRPLAIDSLGYRKHSEILLTFDHLRPGIISTESPPQRFRAFLAVGALAG